MWWDRHVIHYNNKKAEDKTVEILRYCKCQFEILLEVNIQYRVFFGLKIENIRQMRTWNRFLKWVNKLLNRRIESLLLVGRCKITSKN